MNTQDPNLAKVELIAAALGALCDELVFVGGCAAGLLMTDPAASMARVTFEVDLMPTDAGILGFANRWYRDAVVAADRVLKVGSGRTAIIRAPSDFPFP